MSLLDLNKNRVVEGWKKAQKVVKNPQKYKYPDPKEVQRLKNMNVYWLL